MNHNDTSPEAISPTEYAELARDARQLIAAVERATRRTGVLFVATLGLTVAATALGLDLVASLAAVIAVTAFTAALVMLMCRIALGPAPAEVATTTPAGVASEVAQVAERPATGSGPATPTNRRILRK